jgi:RHS repeat-associated protein
VSGVQIPPAALGNPNDLWGFRTPYCETITSGTNLTPFGFQGSYSDATGLTYLINRYYDPSTDQFLSIDPDVASTDQPYVFTNDNPLNAEDPLGLAVLGYGFSAGQFEVPDGYSNAGGDADGPSEGGESGSGDTDESDSKNEKPSHGDIRQATRDVSVDEVRADGEKAYEPDAMERVKREQFES